MWQRHVCDGYTIMCHHSNDSALMQWRRNQRVRVPLLTHGETRIPCEVVNMFGEHESMSGHDLHSLMVQMYSN